MAGLTDLAMQQLISDECQLQVDAATYPFLTTAFNNIASIWLLYQDKAYEVNGIHLRYQYTKRDVLRAVCGGFARFTDFSADITSKDGQTCARYDAMLDKTELNITAIEKLAKGLVGAASGQLTNLAPIVPAGGSPNPNDSVYRGDPTKSVGLQLRF